MSRWHFLMNSSPVLRRHYFNHACQQDSAKYYVDGAYTEILVQLHVPMLPCPAIYQNLPTTEHLWDTFGRHVRYHANSGTAPHYTTP